MALAWDGTRCNHRPRLRLFSIALLIREEDDSRSGNGS
jgi:hypothetical protein